LIGGQALADIQRASKTGGLIAPLQYIYLRQWHLYIIVWKFLNNGLIYTPITPLLLERVVVWKHNYKAYDIVLGL